MIQEFHRTKIICTLGPATDQPGVLEQMAAVGMNVARLNFSHGSQEEHRRRIQMVREVEKKTGMPIGILMDTRGPEIRITLLKDGVAQLEEGQLFTLYAEDREGDANGAAITYPYLAKEVQPGTTILLDDGKISLTVDHIDGVDVVCRVENSGELKNRKSLNIPGCHLELPYISEADRRDILFGCAEDLDFIAASFVRSADDIRELKQLLGEAGALGRVQIIAKLENQEGCMNLDSILEEVDGIMVARGDMGVEIEFDRLPILQKSLIKHAVAKGRIVITATQMLDSMTTSPRPTRAEVSDVANAVFDGTTAVMLSGETSVGEYPVETVDAMRSIVSNAEAAVHYTLRRQTREEFRKLDAGNDPISSEIALAAVTAAERLNAAVIGAVTMSGRTVRAVSCLHPQVRIAGLSPSKKTQRQMTLQFGVLPMGFPDMQAGERQVHKVMQIVCEEGLAKKGELLVYTAGLPAGEAPSTNTLGIRTVE